MSNDNPNSNNSPDYSHEPQQDKMDFQALFQVLIEKGWIILLITLLGLIVGFAYASRLKPLYQASATIEVDKQETKILSIEDFGGQNLGDREVLNTAVESITSSAVLRRVIATNNLTASAEFLLPLIETNQATESRCLSLLEKRVTASLRKDTRLIDIRAQHPNQEMAKRLASSVAEQFLENSLDQRFQAAQKASAFLLTEADELKKRLKDAELAAQAYKEENNAGSLDSQQNIVIGTLQALNEQLTGAKTQRIQLETDYNAATNRLDDPQALLSIASVANHPNVAAVRTRLHELESTLSEYVDRYLDEHPKMIALKKELVQNQEGLNVAAVRAVDSIKSAYDNAVTKEKELAQAVAAQEQAALKLNRAAIEYQVLVRNAETDRALFESVLTRLKETDLTKGIEQNNIRIVERPLGASNLNEDRKWKTAIAAMMAGLFGSLGIVYLIGLADNSIKTVDNAERAFQLPVLTAVPIYKSKKKEGQIDESQIVSANDPKCTCAESFRTLRATLELAGRDEAIRVQMFTSASPSEGKTFCAANYAVSLAHAGHKVLLIDLDLRKPAVRTAFDIPRQTPGVSEVLLGKLGLEEAAYPSNIENLSVLVAGAQVPNPAELLASEWVAQLIEKAKNKYDRVIIDTAPVNAVSDTLVLAKYAQVLSIVVRVAKTPIRATDRAIEMIRRAHVNPTGVILNFMPERIGYGYYYYYYHGKSYGGKKGYGVYGEEENAEKLKS